MESRYESLEEQFHMELRKCFDKTINFMTEEEALKSALVVADEWSDRLKEIRRKSEDDS